MSNTRHAPPGSALQQKRFASSPDIERPLLANLVALRTSSLAPDEAELIWWVQGQSCRPGGLNALAEEIIKCKWHPVLKNRLLSRREETDESVRRLAELNQQFREARRGLRLRQVVDHLPEMLAEFCLNREIPVADGWPTGPANHTRDSYAEMFGGSDPPEWPHALINFRSILSELKSEHTARAE